MIHKRFHCGKYPTIDVEVIANNCETIEEFEQKCPDEMLNDDRRVGYYLTDLLNRYEKKDSQASEAAMLSTGYVNHIANGKRKPSRDILIRICLGLHATVDETQELLKCAGEAPLYVRRKRDVVIWFGLLKKEEVETVNSNLKKRGLKAFY